MAITRSQALFLFFSLSLLSIVSRSPVQAQTVTTATKFTFHGFKGNESAIRNTGASKITADGLLSLTDDTQNVFGTAFYRQPIRLLTQRSHTTSQNVTVRSFSTSFVFVITSPSSGTGGYGFTFALSPSSDRPGADADQYMGLLNKSANGNPSNHVFAVEFDTINGFKDGMDSTGNHIGLNLNDLRSKFQETVFYYENGQKEDFQLQSGEPIRAQIDYDGPTKTLNVTVYPTKLEFKPSMPSISQQVDLSGIVNDVMYVGFTASTGLGGASSHYIMGWSFSTIDGEAAEELDLSKLPPTPKQNRKKNDYKSSVLALVLALSAVTLVLLLLLLFFLRYRRRMHEDEILEDWEIDYPHRFRYKDLYTATNGFRESEIIGTGGFGSVYRGTNGSDLIAVKKITPNSMQGVREFVAEIESLGRLRHRNLVNLQGWCKHKKDLLLIYDYIPNGSLDALLYKKPRTHGVVLTWKERFTIAKGIANGLTYLHEEWEQVVIHRDVKSSNVLIDAEMNPRLGDFGLARHYDRGTMSHTTHIVGTIGYIAPELARNGKASTASDVFAFGVLLLEIVSGRKPTDSGNFFLADWVMELYERGEILKAVDRKLGSEYVEEEVKLVLVVGLLCCHQSAAFRPPMRRVWRFLNGDDVVPVVDSEWGSIGSSRDEFGSNFLRDVYSDMATSSISVTRVSSSSVATAR